jgi:hypothetical protein
MRSRIDDRGQAIQIGAVLLFGLLVIAFATYQAFVVPDQNKQVEFKHSQAVQQDLQDLRNEIVSLSGSRAASVAVPLGTQYPSRAVALNPSPPSGSIRTAGTSNASLNLTIRNATGSGSVGDFWNGSTRRYATGALVYQPNYNVFQGEPTVVYENSILFNQYRDQNVTLTGQRLVDGTSISLVTLNGSLSETRSGSYSVEVDPASVSETRIDIENETHNITLSFPTRLGVGRWRALLADEPHVVGVTAERLSRDRQLVHVDLEPGVKYDLRMKKVGVGTRIEGTSASYLVPADGNGTTVPEGGTARLVVEVRDAYNNPISGQTVNASASLPGGTVSPTQRQTNGAGRVVLAYDAPDDIDGVAQRIDEVNVSFATDTLNDSAFRPDTAASATVRVRVRNADDSGFAGGRSAYAVDWKNPDSKTGVTCSPDENGICTINGSKVSNSEVELGIETTPIVDGGDIEYRVGDTGIATVSPLSGTTDGVGEDTTTLKLKQNGSVNVYATGGGSGDRLDVEIEDLKQSATTLGVVFADANTLKSIGKTGESVTTYTGITADAIGPKADLDGDTATEIPYVTGGNLKIVDVGGGDVTTLDSSGKVSGSMSRLGVGDFDGDGDTEVYYTRGNNNKLYRASATDGPTKVDPNSAAGTAVGGVADIDGDGAVELVFANQQTLRYVDDDNTVKDTGYSSLGSNNGIGLGTPADFDGDGTARTPVVTGSNNIALVDQNGNTEVLDPNYQSATKAPVAAADVDDDSDLEVVFVAQSGNLAYSETDGTVGTVKDSGGSTIPGDGDTGVT